MSEQVVCSKLTKILASTAFLLAAAASFYLFFIPAFKEYQGIIFLGSPPPALETGWKHFAFWPPMRDTPADPIVFVCFIAPVIVTAAAALAAWSKHRSVRIMLLWSFWVMLLIPILIFFSEYGGPLLYFVPSAVFLLAAALIETIKFKRSGADERALRMSS